MREYKNVNRDTKNEQTSHVVVCDRSSQYFEHLILRLHTYGLHTSP